VIQKKTTMWANAQRDGHPTEYRWRPLFNAAKMANFWRYLGPALPASCVQHISDLHSKFALRPHMFRSMVYSEATKPRKKRR